MFTLIVIRVWEKEIKSSKSHIEIVQNLESRFCISQNENTIVWIPIETWDYRSNVIYVQMPKACS